MIFSIPSLITRTPLFDIERDIRLVIDPIVTFKYPEIQITSHYLPDSWYFGDLSSFPLYLFPKGGVGSHKLEFSSDLNHLTLSSIVNTIPLWQIPSQYYNGQKESYRICQNSSVTIFSRGVYLTAITVDFSSDLSQTTRLAHTVERRSFCPASSRLVYIDTKSNHIVVSDFCR